MAEPLVAGQPIRLTQGTLFSALKAPERTRRVDAFCSRDAGVDPDQGRNSRPSIVAPSGLHGGGVFDCTDWEWSRWFPWTRNLWPPPPTTRTREVSCVRSLWL